MKLNNTSMEQVRTGGMPIKRGGSKVEHRSLTRNQSEMVKARP